ncbi:MAG: aldo/keto reductase, partial [Bacteroidales bacterium]|nr:aldo/keto reductase [Bacteroidales bacterium]
MQTRILGKDLGVSAVGLGCMGLSHAYGPATEKGEAVRLIRQAYEDGYTFFDTAECYTGNYEDGSISYNEEIVGEALQPIRDKVMIATKCGVHHSSEGLVMDSRPDTIRASIEGSLKKLRTDHVDLYYQHRIDPKVPAEEVAGVMAELMREGKITHWGISETDEEYLR